MTGADAAMARYYRKFIKVSDLRALAVPVVLASSVVGYGLLFLFLCRALKSRWGWDLPEWACLGAGFALGLAEGIRYARWVARSTSRGGDADGG